MKLMFFYERGIFFYGIFKYVLMFFLKLRMYVRFHVFKADFYSFIIYDYSSNFCSKITNDLNSKHNTEEEIFLEIMQSAANTHNIQIHICNIPFRAYTQIQLY